MKIIFSIKFYHFSFCAQALMLSKSIIFKDNLLSTMIEVESLKRKRLILKTVKEKNNMCVVYGFCVALMGEIV